MKSIIKNIKRQLVFFVPFILCLCLISSTILAQDNGKPKAKKSLFARMFNKESKLKPVKNVFQSVWITDNQTVIVPKKGTFEFDIMHRFGVINNGYKDFYGFFAPSNIRLGMNYAPIKNLYIGIGLTKSNMILDGNAKYAIISQTKGKWPVSVTYYGNMAVDTRKDVGKAIFKYSSQRFSYFHQLIIARKITNKLSLQVAPSLSHQNSVTGFYSKNDSTGKTIFRDMKFDHFAIALAARYKLTTTLSLMLNYDQPLTRHPANNPNPNIAFGIEINTSSHSMQVFIGNYSYMVPQRNNMFNTNNPFGYDDATKTHPVRNTDDPKTIKDESTRVMGGRFVIGFNITRLWNF